MKRTRAPFLKRVVSLAASVTLAFSLLPAQALALGEIDQWSPPGKTATSFEKDGKTYSYIKSATHRRTEAVADYLGISNVSVHPIRTGKAFPYQEEAAAAYEIAAKTGRMGIFGTDVNENLNPWYGNFFYNITQLRDGKDDRAAQDDVLVFTLEGDGPMNADTDIIDEYGTSASLYLRPDILFGTGNITDANGETVTLGNYSSNVTCGYSELVNKIRNKELGKYNDVDLYKSGDENYDPWYVQMSVAPTNREDINMLYDLATAAENIIQSTKDTANPKITRYGDPMEIAQLFEEWIVGTQMAVVKAIDEGKVQKKTVGVLKSSPDPTNGQVVFQPTGDNGSFEYLQEVCNNIMDVNGLEGGVGDADDVMKCSAIFLSSSADKDKLTGILEDAGYKDASKYPDIYTTGPDAVLQLTHECEACMSYGFLIGFAYPEVINPVDAVAFYYRSFYHIKKDRLADALGMQISKMSLPSGVELNINNFSEESFRTMLDDAVLYYDANKDKMAESHPSITISENFKMPEKKADPVTPTPVVNPTSKPAAQTISAKNVTKSYKGKKNKLVKAQSIQLKSAAKVSAKTAVSYTKANKVGKTKIAVAKNGKMTIKKGLKKGTYKVKVKLTAAATSDYATAEKTITVTVKVK